ncbi:MAG: hypothetical protein HFJ12_07320 [Bacilli bacterium]|nr:hypothetical protein [Bacilli bacterium]
MRKYDDEKELICTIRGTSSVVEDTKNMYLELFENARMKYNEKQTRNDRKIENYFNHISNDNKRDLACEIIIELGDMDFWVGKSDVFTKVSLQNIQDKMREYCIDSFNRIYHLNYTLKVKEDGRNVDINVANMNEYKKFKREQEKYKKQLK